MIPFLAWVDTVGFWDWWFFGFGISIGLAIGAGGMCYYFDKKYQPMLGYYKAHKEEEKRKMRHKPKL